MRPDDQAVDPGCATCRDGTVVRWDAEGVSIESVGGPPVHFAAPATTLQLSRAELPGPPSALQRLLRQPPSRVPHLVVELRSGTRRLALCARAEPDEVAELARLDSAGDHLVEHGELRAMVEALRAGGANVARGQATSSQASTLSEIGLDYAGVPAWRWLRNVGLGATLSVAGLVALARGGLQPWGLAAAWAGFVVSLVVFAHHRARSKIAAAHRESPPSATTGWVALAVLGAVGCWLATMVLAMKVPDAVGGALVVAGLLPLWLGLMQRGLRSVHWVRARLDTHGLHGWRPGRPREEHIGWASLPRLRERAVNEGCQRFHHTALLADALHLASLAPGARPAALRALADEPLEARRARLPDLQDWLAWQPSSPRPVQFFVLTMLVLVGILVVPFTLPMGLALTDVRVWTLVAVSAVFASMMASTHITRGVDRGQRLWLQVTRRLGSPHRGAALPYAFGPRDILTATAIDGFELAHPPGEGVSLKLSTRGDSPVTIEHISDQAAGRARLETLERFFHGGPPATPEHQQERA